MNTSGCLWFATTGLGVSRYDGTNWRQYHHGGRPAGRLYIDAITKDWSGALWFSNFNGGLARLRTA